MKLIPASIRIRGFSIATATLITLATKSQMIGAPATRSVVPKLWDEAALASMTLPAAIPGNRILYVSADYYYSIPVMPAWKSYPVYAPGKEPRGYLEWLKTLEPEKIFDAPRMKTQNDWIKAGRVIFDTPYELTPLDKSPVRDREWFEKLNPPLAKDNTITAYRYVVRKRGEIEVGGLFCGSCHSRVMPDGGVIKGEQGNFPIPAQHRDKYKIKDVRVGTDERSATVSVRGRGYYKVPSLLGVWYRGPFEHNGSVATLEDWFDERRLNPDYVPTGFKGYGVKRRAVKGHEFGLDLSPEDKQALIAFLKTL